MSTKVITIKSKGSRYTANGCFSTITIIIEA